MGVLLSMQINPNIAPQIALQDFGCLSIALQEQEANIRGGGDHVTSNVEKHRFAAPKPTEVLDCQLVFGLPTGFLGLKWGFE